MSLIALHDSRRNPPHAPCRGTPRVCMVVVFLAALCALNAPAQEMLEVVGDPRAEKVLGDQTALSPSAIDHLGRPVVAVAAASNVLLAAAADARELLCFDATSANFNWRMPMAALPGEPSALALLPGGDDLMPGVPLAACVGRRALYTWGVGEKIARERPLPMFDPSATFAVSSLSYDHEKNQLLLVYASTLTLGKPEIVLLDRNLRMLANLTRSLPDWLPISAPFFATWCNWGDRNGGSAVRRGVLFPFGEGGHDGIAWMPCENTVASGDECRLFRVVGCPDRTFSTAAVSGDVLYLVGAETDRLYSFALAFTAPTPRVEGLTCIPTTAPAAYYVCWNGAALSGGAVELFEAGRRLSLSPVPGARGSVEVQGLVPGALITALTRDDSGRTGTFTSSAPLPSPWVRFGVATAGLGYVTAVTYQPQAHALVLADTAGTLASCPFGQIEPFLGDEHYQHIVVAEPLQIVADSLVSACEVSPRSELVIVDGWTGRVKTAPFTTQLFDVPVSSAVDYVEGLFIWDAAFSPNGELIVADAGGGRVIAYERQASGISPYPVVPLDGIACPAGGPFGVATVGNEVFFLARTSARGGIELWSSVWGPPDGFGRARPHEVVPAPAGSVVTSMASVEVDGNAYLVVAGNERSGPFLLVRPLPPTDSQPVYTNERLELAAGAEFRPDRLAATLVGEVTFTLALRVLDSMEDAPVELVLAVDGVRPEPRTDEMISVPSGDCVLRRYAAAGQSIDVSVRVQTACVVALDVIARTPIVLGPNGERPFRRGDVNSNGSVEIGDAIALLGYLFAGRALTCCDDAADVNDDGQLVIADPIALLGSLFGSRTTLGAVPLAKCDFDPTWDDLPLCKTPSPCTPAQ